GLPAALVFDNNVLLAPVYRHVLQNVIGRAIMGRVVRSTPAAGSAACCGTFAAVVTDWTKGHALFLGEVILIFRVPAVNASHLYRMAPDHLGVIILPRIEVFAVAPRSEAPNRGEAAAVDPHRRIVGRIARRREKGWYHPVQSL